MNRATQRDMLSFATLRACLATDVHDLDSIGVLAHGVNSEPILRRNVLAIWCRKVVPAAFLGTGDFATLTIPEGRAHHKSK